jgi:hypothetical protein
MAQRNGGVVGWLKKVSIQGSIICFAGSVLGAVLSGLFTGHSRNQGDESKGAAEFHSFPDETEIKRVVMESGMREIAFYMNPESYDKNLLHLYWLLPEEGGKATDHIDASIARLLNKGWHYGKEAKADLFEFRSVRLFPPGDCGEVRTRERWQLPLYRKDNNRVWERNLTHGPYEVDYALRKINGKWRIQSTNAPYAR